MFEFFSIPTTARGALYLTEYLLTCLIDMYMEIFYKLCSANQMIVLF